MHVYYYYIHKNKSPADDRRDEEVFGTGFAHVFDQFLDQFGGGATGRRRAGADRGRVAVCRGAAFVGPTRRRREVAVADDGRGRADEGADRTTEAEAGRTAPAEAGRTPKRDRFFDVAAAAAARARLMLRLSGRGGLPGLKASLWRRPRVGGRCRFPLINVGRASASSRPRIRRSWGSKCVS